ncbi:ATP-binding protein [Wukongibacter baidiensis]|uniref:ATP-binding protein n=1 Tax=Wukongibacter baidiensis TaxID=1723361 RepID=UPI003D7F3816
MNLQLSNRETLLKELTVESNLEGFMSIKEISKETCGSILKDEYKFKEYLLCIDEIFCNCIAHAYEGKCGEISVRFYLNDEYLKVSIKDFGIGIPVKYTKEIPGLSNDLLAESGRGLVIVNSMCDKLIIKRNEDSGTEVIIYFKKGW